MAAGGVWGLQMGPMATALANSRLVLFALCARSSEPGRLPICKAEGLPNLTGPVAGSSALAPIYFNLRCKPLRLVPASVRAASRLPAIDQLKALTLNTPVQARAASRASPPNAPTAPNAKQAGSFSTSGVASRLPASFSPVFYTSHSLPQYDIDY